MADTRNFLKLTLGFTEHPKIIEVGPLATWMHLCALDYCARNKTDGYFSAAVIFRIAGLDEPKQMLKLLLEQDLWHETGHNCPRCPPVPPRKILIHDYLEHQTSAAQREEVHTKRVEAGRKGGQARVANMQARSASKQVLKQNPSSAQAPAKQTSSKPQAEVEVEVEEEEKTPKVKTPTPRKRAVKKPAAQQETLPVPAPDPEVTERERLAREILQWWWDQLEVKPAGKNAWHASLRIISNLLAVGHEPKAVAAAAREVGTPLTIPRMEISLNRGKTSMNGHKPSTTEQRVNQAMELVEYYQQRGE